MQSQQTLEQLKLAGDGAAAGISVAAIVGWLPHVAAVLSIVWAAWRIYNEYLDSKIKKATLKNIEKNDA